MFFSIRVANFCRKLQFVRYLFCSCKKEFNYKELILHK
jgi:hypothetical protein